MSDAHTQPAVVGVPGAQPQDGHEHFWSPRNIIAFAMVLLFAAVELLPYWQNIPVGRNGDLILQGAKTVETIIMLVLAFFFGTTVNASRTAARAENNAAAAAVAAAAQPSAPADQALRLEPPFTLRAEEPVHGPEADAGSPTAQPAGLPAEVGVRPRPGRPAE
jgi:hypothetical protein